MSLLKQVTNYCDEIMGDSKKRKIAIGVCSGVAFASYFVYRYYLNPPRFKHKSTYSLATIDEKPDYSKIKQKWVTNPWETRPISMSKTGPGSWKPVTTFEVFDKMLENNASDYIYIQQKQLDDGDWIEIPWTVQNYYNECVKFGKCLISLGLKQFDGVCMIGFNCIEMVITHIGSIYGGCIISGIYATANPGQCKYIINHMRAKIIFVENEKQLNKFVIINSELINTTHIVIWGCKQDDICITNANNKCNKIKIIHWNTFISLYNDNNEKAKENITNEMNKRISNISASNCCVLIYTSGTTGPPKAVMLSHDNLTWQIRTVIEHQGNLIDQLSGKISKSCSYLPLNHGAAIVFDIYFPMGAIAWYNIKHCVTFARPDALKGSLSTTIKSIQPNLWGGVPRVWEKFKSAIENKMKQNPPSWIKGILVKFLRKQAIKAYINMQYGESGYIPFGYSLLCQRLLFSKLKTALGINNTILFMSGAAPISPSTLKWWGSFGVYIYEIYGMSELSGVCTMNVPHYARWGTVGAPIKGLEIKILRNGEICVRGRTTMLGYMYDIEKTKKTIDNDGFVHSGDIGVIDNDGFLKITGRIKELIITEGGENVAPIPIEDYIKKECKFISNCVIIGDKRKYLTCLITLQVNEKKDDNNEYTNILTDNSVDNKCVTVQDAMKSDKYKKSIQNAINKYNNDKIICVSRATRIQYFTILENEFSISSGELTDTQKLKRSIVHKKYKNIIDKMYQN